MAAKNTGAKPSLLIVEDDGALLQMLAWEFEELGYRVTAADSCKKARMAARSTRFDFALLDYNLPDGTGIELMDALHATHLPMSIILCSGMAGEEAAACALSRGVVCFVSKPILPATLHRKFQQASARNHRSQ